MPTGTPYNSYVLPYRIRVDDFSSPQDPTPTPLLHLLTHTHSDHINGLSARSFGYKVICSKDAKEMLLRHEVYAERELQALNLRTEKIRTYAHLKVDPLLKPDGTMYYNGSRDLLHPLPLNTPTSIELTSEESVTITLLDANHCPGAVMYLIEGAQGSILHTGDFRAEPWFLQSLTRNPFLQPYLAPGISHQGTSNLNGEGSLVSKTLEAIYLDTACVLSPISAPTKDSATAGLVELIRLYPHSVFFFINCWTWGYEDIIKAIARAFQVKIHVDKYKHSVFQHITDPFLKFITTRDPSSTRFHACERFHRCAFVDVENDASYSNATSVMGKRVVYVNPVNMSIEAWDKYLESTSMRIRNGEEVNNLLVPLSRHSALPELQAFVKLFLPTRVVPNTLDPRLLGVDWVYIDRVFASCLHPSARTSTTRYDKLRFETTGQEVLGAVALDDCDVAFKNLVGNGASDVAEKWADDGNLRKKLSFIKSHLGDEEKQLMDRLLGKECLVGRTLYPVRTDDKAKVLQPNVRKALACDRSNNFPRDSEDDTDGDDEDERGRTAHVLFAGLAGIDPEDKENTWSFASPPSSAEKDCAVESTSRFNQKGRGELVHGGAWRLNRLTPISSPIRPLPAVSRKVVPSTPKRLPKATQGQTLKPFQLCVPADKSSSMNNSPPAKGSLKSPIVLLASSPQENTSNTPTSHLDLCTSMQTPVDSSAPSKLPVTNCQGLLQWGSMEELRKDLTKSNCASVIVPRKRLPESVGYPYRPKKLCLATDAKSDSRLAQAIPSAPPSDHTIPRITDQETPNSLLSVPWVRTEREHWHDKRMAMSCKVAEALPHMVAPSYQKKRTRQLAQLERKIKGRLQSPAPMDHLINPEMTPNTLSRKLVPESTTLSLKSMIDDNEEKPDWNRSRMLAEAIKGEVAQGRKPTIPLLQCVQSQSQSHP